ncbi:hypothetical protein LXA47_07660 [Massilia sp. P8910]|uniref:hypothetical protein n=1 Tax=Massilia antarctica TaxID=2765360 RepID=UPI001E32C9BC|nr:hypothetical protein [Massilia antarctica]MCE3603481.1 hypothetical protein [Massilia antarctica]
MIISGGRVMVVCESRGTEGEAEDAAPSFPQRQGGAGGTTVDSGGAGLAGAAWS